MGLQQFLLAFLSAGMLFFALYYLLAVIFIHKKIFDKHFYFFIASFIASFFGFFQILLTLPFSNEQYLFFHRIRLFTIELCIPFYLFTLYSCYFDKLKKSYLAIILIPYIILSSFAFSNISLSYPIKVIEFNIFGSTQLFHLSTSQLFYNIFAIYTLLLFINQFFLY